jgi:hypothetical protein
MKYVMHRSMSLARVSMQLHSSHHRQTPTRRHREAGTATVLFLSSPATVIDTHADATGSAILYNKRATSE